MLGPSSTQSFGQEELLASDPPAYITLSKLTNKCTYGKRYQLAPLLEKLHIKLLDAIMET